MKRMLIGFVALALLMVAECPAGGSKGTTFYLYCGFESLDFIDGSVINIDTSHGDVVSADLTLYDYFYDSEVAVFSTTPTVSTNAAGNVEITVYGVNLQNYPSVIVLTLPVNSLKKYTGGPVIANYASYWEDNVYFTIDYLTYGHISP